MFGIIQLDRVKEASNLILLYKSKVEEVVKIEWRVIVASGVLVVSSIGIGLLAFNLSKSDDSILRASTAQQIQMHQISTKTKEKPKDNYKKVIVATAEVKRDLPKYNISRGIEKDSPFAIKMKPIEIKKKNISSYQQDIKVQEDVTVLLKIKNVDKKYKGSIVKLSDNDRDFLEHLVMGEAGDEGYIGAALVAQAIRDAMVSDKLSARQVQNVFKYTHKIGKKPNKDVKDAVAYIFDDGGCAVQHRVLYFYAPKLVKSRWHETEEFVVEYRGHRMFDRRVDVGIG